MKAILLLCPIRREVSLLKNSLMLKGMSFTEQKIGSLSVFHCAETQLYLGCGGYGKVQFALQAQYLIDRLENIGTLICAGTAGGLNPSVKAGDVVIASKTIEHDFKEKFVKRPSPEFLGDPQWLAQFKQININTFNLFISPIASGDEDILELTRAQELQNTTQAFAVAWEGAGGGRVAQFNRLPYLEIRAISDLANSSAPTDFTANLELAMNNISTLLGILLAKK